MFRRTAVFLLAATVAASASALTDPELQGDILQHTGDMLMADPQTIIEVRKAIQTSSAARRAPIVNDFSEDMDQSVLDLDDVFDLDLEPGGVAPRISIARYQSTAVSFVDAFGNPWPIRRVSNFMGGLIAIDRATGDDEVVSDDPQAGSFTVTALSHGVVGNITVYLVGLSTPISLIVEGKSGIFHRTATMRVNEAGPQTDLAQMFADSGNAVRVGVPVSVDLNNALYGVTPSGATPMVLTGGEGRAWVKGDHMYVQTSLAIFSPAIIDTAYGNGRFRAYQLPLAPLVMGTNIAGQTVTMRIERTPMSALDDRTLAVGGGK